MEAQALVGFELFEGLDEAQLAACAELFDEQLALMGEVLTTEDDFSYSLLLVLSGEVKVVRHGTEVARLGAGDYFGEVGLVTGNRRNASVIATETCHVAKLMTWDFATLEAQHPVLAQRLEAKAAERS